MWTKKNTRLVKSLIIANIDILKSFVRYQLHLTKDVRAKLSNILDLTIRN